jgi:hypothetical protein
MIRIAPKPEINVKISPRKSVEIVTATIISVNNATADVTGEISFNAISHR